MPVKIFVMAFAILFCLVWQSGISFAHSTSILKNDMPKPDFLLSSLQTHRAAAYHCIVECAVPADSSLLLDSSSSEPSLLDSSLAVSLSSSSLGVNTLKASSPETHSFEEDTLSAPLRPFRYTPDGSIPQAYTQLNPLKTALVGGGFTALLGGLQVYQHNAFWADRTTFRIIDDGDLEYGADKGGHIFAAHIMSKLATDALLTSGFSHDFSVIGGGLIGAGYQFFVEVQDGFGKNWGFSPSDVYANTAGAMLHIAQHFIPAVSHISMKAEYYPAPWFGEKMRKYAANPIDDYSAWTWWLSVDVHGILPEEAKPFWPPWLTIAVGYAARNLEWENASRRYIVSVDYNLEKLLPDGSPLWNWFRQYLNVLKLPSPAVEFAFTPDGKLMGPPRFYIVFPFKLASFSF